MTCKLEHRTTKRISAGSFYPRGAIIKRDGVNFAIYSRHAQEVFLLLFDNKSDGMPTDIISLKHRTGSVWHSYVHGIKAGQLYGYKVCGKFNPKQAMRYNEHKLLIDPYAKALTHKAENIDDLLLAYDPKSKLKDLSMDKRDNAHIVPKAIVIDDTFDWQGDAPPNIPLEELIIYEVHVKGFTAHRSSKVQHSGTYLGMIEKIPYLKKLGITAVELMPMQEHMTSDFLAQKGLKEYWGYNTIGYFAPESSYGTGTHLGCQVQEFKTLVRELHKAGIEVILDVVYNHTGEGNELEPTLCLRGIDNSIFYALKGSPDEPYRYYRDEETGCGNSLNVERASVRFGVLDSMRYWVEVMHVDGFRFDLAPALGREKGEFRANSAFFKAIFQDPVLNRVKKIVEPWDLSAHHYGEFPNGWLEWNDKFRDTIRRFNKGDPGSCMDLAWRLMGSQDLCRELAKNPYESINFVTCHDGFTLRDLYSYEHKHNEANKEKNKDGTDHNFSWNCGVEGETTDAKILKIRMKLMKNVFCSLFFSLGTPMLLCGDERMRTQKGNNNAYCQDNDISWLNWDLIKENKEIYDFCQKAIQFRKRHKILQNRMFVLSKDMGINRIFDVLWFDKNLKKPAWNDPKLKLLCYQLHGFDHALEYGYYHLFFIFNSGETSQKVKLPVHEELSWHRVLDTHYGSGKDFLDAGQEELFSPNDVYTIAPRSIVVLLGK